MEAWKLGGLKAWRLGGLDVWTLGVLEAWRLGGLDAWRLGGLLGPSWKALEGFLEPLGNILEVSWAA